MTLNPQTVGQAALDAVASLAEARDTASATLFPFLTVSEPVVDLLPEYFLLDGARASVDESTLHQLAVAGKLLYAHIRWLDQLADQRGSPDQSLVAHSLNCALSRLIQETFASALNAAAAPTFFSTLAHLYSRYAMSLAVDKGSSQSFGSPLLLEQYLLHANARAAPIRAPVDAILLLTNATPEETQLARTCCENYAAALQLFDDALDAEEDYAERRLNWVVQRVIARLHDSEQVEDPDTDLFYRTALLDGILVETLSTAEALFLQSANAAGRTYPRWAICSNHMMETTRQLKNSYQEVIADAD